MTISEMKPKICHSFWIGFGAMPSLVPLNEEYISGIPRIKEIINNTKNVAAKPIPKPTQTFAAHFGQAGFHITPQVLHSLFFEN